VAWWVGEECCTGSRYYKDLVPEDGATVDEMLDDIADRYLNIQCAIFTPNQGRRDDVIRMARELHADGIIDASLSFCTIYEMEAFDMEKAAQEAGIPYMHLSTDYSARGRRPAHNAHSGLPRDDLAACSIFPVGPGGRWLPGPFCVSRSLAVCENHDARQLGKRDLRFSNTDKERG
jgi:hypothetical protein